MPRFGAEQINLDYIMQNILCRFNLLLLLHFTLRLAGFRDRTHNGGILNKSF